MAVETPQSPKQTPYDDGPGNRDSLPPSNEGLRHITGISPDEEEQMDKQAADDVGQIAKKERAGDGFNYSGGNSQSKHPDQVGQGFTGGISAAAPWKKKKFIAAAGGFAGIAAVISIVSIFSFLNVFKLDHLMSNIDARTFARMNGSMDRRTTSWIVAYMQLRMADIVPADGSKPNFDKPNDPDNLIFRSNRVDTNNPLFDWYKTMRTSSFEQDVFEKHGIKFTSIAKREGNKIVFRHGFISNNEVPTSDFIKLSPDEANAVLKGDVNKLNGKLSKFVDVHEIGGDKAARAEIKSFVKENTRWNQVFKRRIVRKSIQNMTGVRDWRFFEDKRNKFDEKKIDIRNKLITKAFPETTKSGKFINCLFGISDCVYNSDPSAPSNNEGGSFDKGNINEGSDVTRQETPDGKALPAEKVPLGPAADAVKKITADILSKANVALSAINIVSTLDTFSHIDKAVTSHQLSKSIAVARGVQAMGLYQVFETARDQVKTGNVQAAELNTLMPLVATAASSQGYSQAVEGNGSMDKTDNSQARKDYCDPKHQQYLQDHPEQAAKEYAYRCDEKQIGGGTKAASIESAYNGSVGKIIHPLAVIYNKARGAPIIGKVVDITMSLFNTVSQFVTDQILSVTGLKGPITELMGNVTARLVAFLGAGPITNGTDTPGVLMNWVVQGGAYTAEAVSRAAGASITTLTSAKQADSNVAMYQQDDLAQQSLFNKYLSASNPQSPTSSALVAFGGLGSSSVGDLFGSMSKYFKSFSVALMSPFLSSAKAADQSPYKPANFAGIKTYDYPTQCYNSDPLTATPQSGTNIQEVIPNVPSSDLTWDLVTNSDAWYAYIYHQLEGNDNADSIAETIYNCNLLDNSIRGSLGYVYGYNKDNGLDDTTSSVSTIANSTATTTPANTINMNTLFNSSVDVSCAPNTKDLGIQEGWHDGSMVKIRICALSNLPSGGSESSGEYGVTGANGLAVVNSRVSSVYYNLVEAAKKDGITMQATSTFRSMAHQQCLYAHTCGSNEAAKPGYSNHQMGLAIDFGTSSGVTISQGDKWFNWLNSNAPSFGIKNYPAENWHWSPTGN